MKWLAKLADSQKLHVTYDKRIHYGANQHWFMDSLKVMGGCGPVVGFNLGLLNDRDGLLEHTFSDQDILDHLNQWYGFMKPFEIRLPEGLHKKLKIPKTLGIYSLNRMASLLTGYYVEKNTSPAIEKVTLDSKTYKDLVMWIRAGLDGNKPILLLNTFRKSMLHVDNMWQNGMNQDPEILKSQEFRVHWVLITGIFIDEKNRHWLECSTWGKKAYVDLGELYHQKPMLDRVFKSGFLNIEHHTDA